MSALGLPLPTLTRRDQFTRLQERVTKAEAAHKPNALEVEAHCQGEYDPYNEVGLPTELETRYNATRREVDLARLALADYVRGRRKEDGE